MSLIMVPERPEGRSSLDVTLAPVATSTMDAIVRGTATGLELLLNICAMLIVLIALVHLVNAVLGLVPEVAGAPVTLERMLGIAMAPVCWLIGIPWGEAATAGSLMGIKTILNEFVAYLKLAAAGRRAQRPLAIDLALCAMRLRQFRQPRHSDRRPCHLGAGAPRRRGVAWVQIDRVGHARNLPGRRRSRRSNVRA
jgi:CNT family concentrative nucleoside transporter